MGKKQRKRESAAVKQNTEIQQSELRALSAEELAHRAQRGCEVSFAELAERYGARLFHFLHYKTGSVQDAEDLAQDTFVKAYQNIHRYSNSWKFSTWLFTIAKRLASSYYRSLRYSQSVAEVEGDSPEPVEMATQEETRQSLWAMARGLSRNQYQALWLKYAEDMSIKEIAQVMRKSQVNVKVLLYRGRINLAERLRNTASENEVADQMSSKETLSFMKVEGA
jgi:RNA polymerase sigma-70 factor (ECF subfamily)